jgi:hypothetical protein
MKSCRLKPAIGRRQVCTGIATPADKLHSARLEQVAIRGGRPPAATVFPRHPFGRGCRRARYRGIARSSRSRWSGRGPRSGEIGSCDPPARSRGQPRVGVPANRWYVRRERDDGPPLSSPPAHLCALYSRNDERRASTCDAVQERATVRAVRRQDGGRPPAQRGRTVVPGKRPLGNSAIVRHAGRSQRVHALDERLVEGHVVRPGAPPQRLVVLAVPLDRPLDPFELLLCQVRRPHGCTVRERMCWDGLHELSVSSPPNRPTIDLGRCVTFVRRRRRAPAYG